MDILYGTDLARVHHEHFGQTAEAAATELLRRLRARDLTSGTVVDLACGSGILSRRALDAGFDVWAADVSPHMVQLARAQAPGARVDTGSLWDVELPACAAVAAVGEAFSYATDAFTPDIPRLEERFEGLARALAPGGLLLFDVPGPGRGGPSGSRQRVWERGEVLLHLVETEKTDPPRLTREIQTFVPAGSLYRRSRESHRLTLFDPDEVQAALDRRGFAVERLETYAGATEPLAGWHLFAAEKRGRVVG